MDYTIVVEFTSGRTRHHYRKYLKYGCIKNWISRRYTVKKVVTDNKFKYSYIGLRSNVKSIQVLGKGNEPIGSYVGNCKYVNGL